MKRNYIVFFVTVVLCLLLVGVVTAVPTALNIPWWTMDNGGGTSSGGGYTLSGTIGQPEVGIVQSGSNTLGSGFWQGGEIPDTNLIFLPLIQ